jgi:hypothetical protein
MRIFVAALLAIGTLSAPALGDDVKTRMKEFDLIGTWSPDCGKDILERTGRRAVFAAPREGMPTATFREGDDGVLVTGVHEIVQSTVVDGDKISIAFHPVTITRADGKASPQSAYNNYRMVFQKAGAKIKVIGIQFEGLPNVEREIFLEKCPG